MTASLNNLSTTSTTTGGASSSTTRFPAASPSTAFISTLEEVDSKRRFDEVIHSGGGSKLVIISFWAPWCKNCKKIAPAVEAMGKSKQEVLNIYRVNTTFAEDIGTQQGIDALPTFQFYKGGVKLGEFKGSNFEALQKTISSFI